MNLVAGASAGLGVAFDKLGQYTKAIEYHDQALLTYRKLGDKIGEGGVWNLGNSYLHLGQYAKVIEYHDQALLIYRKVSDKSVKALRLVPWKR